MKKVLIGLVLGCTLALTGMNFGYITADWSLLREASYGIGNAYGAVCGATKISATQLLTASHCVEMDEELVVYNNTDVVGKAVVVAKSPSKDVAILEILEGVEGTYVPVASQEALQDEQIVLVGYPLGVGEVATTGFVQGLYPIPFTNGIDEIYINYTLITAPGTFGNSGGGAFVYRYFLGWQLVGTTSRVVMQPVYTPYGEGASPYNNLIIISSVTEINDFFKGLQ